MEYTYILRINYEQNQLENITNILGTLPSNNKFYWELILIQKDSEPYIDFINKFLNLLEGKYDQLSQIGIERDDITVWILYEYDRECNLEFSPEQMKRLGVNGITLCVSCWQSSEKTNDK